LAPLALHALGPAEATDYTWKFAALFSALITNARKVLMKKAAETDYVLCARGTVSGRVGAIRFLGKNRTFASTILYNVDFYPYPRNWKGHPVSAG
jgi:hypothetical protein